MRVYLLLLILFISVTSVTGQAKTADIKLYGLTCSLCSRSVEKSLEKVSFVDEINTDLETTLTTITFKENTEIYPEELADAVEKAGFSVGFIQLNYNFKEPITTCFEGPDEGFTFLGDTIEKSAGTYPLVIIDKKMMSRKIFKQFKDQITTPCNTSKRHYYVALADQLLPE